MARVKHYGFTFDQFTKGTTFVAEATQCGTFDGTRAWVVGIDFNDIAVTIRFVAVIVLSTGTLWCHIKRGKFMERFFIVACKIIPAVASAGFADPDARLFGS